MSLTPAPTQLSSSAPESARPRIPSHNSSPSLNTAMQQQSALLTPPKPGKKTKARPSTAGSAAPSSQAQVPAPAPAPVPGKPLSQVPPTSTTTSRDTRSRYRSVNSAPNTPSASRNVSPDAPSSIASRPKSMANNMSAQQPAAPSLKSQSVSLQNIPNAAKPRVDPMHPPNPNPTQTRKSMPNLQAGPTGKVPVYAHTQQVQGMPQGAPLPPQGYQFQGFSPALAMGPAQSAQIPGVPPFPHQGFAGPVESTHIGPAHHAQFHPTPPIPQQGFSGQIEYGSVGPAHQAQFHPAPPIPQQNFTSQFQPGPPGPTYNGHINANPIPPQARGRHHVPKPAANPIGHPEEKLRRVVGHDGVYGAPAKQAPAKPTPKFPEHQSTKTYGSPSLSSFVFELDAGPSEPIKPFIPQPSGFIAELPAVDVSPINWPVEPQTGTLAAPAALKQPEHDVSSIAPPKTMQTTPAVIAASASTASSTHLPGSTFPPHAVSAPVPVPIPANARISTYLPPHIPTATSHSAPVPTSHLVSAYVHPEPAIVPPPAPASSSVPSYAPPAIPTVEPTPGPVTNLPTPPTEVPEPPQTTIHPSLLEALPASLMIGGPVCPRRSPNNSLSGPSTHSSNVATNSNAQIYQRYYSPPSSTPSSTQPSPRQDPVYKAYSRPISPPAIGAGLSNSHSAPHVSHGQGTYPISQSMPLGRTVDPLTPQTPADMLGLSLSEAPKPNYEHVNDACKPQAQAHPIHNSFAPQQPPEFFNPFASYEPGHKRSASHESQASNASHDSTKLAAEYQQELPDFDNGYSSKAAAAPVANYTGAGYGRRDSMDFT